MTKKIENGAIPSRKKRKEKKKQTWYLNTKHHDGFQSDALTHGGFHLGWRHVFALPPENRMKNHKIIGGKKKIWKKKFFGKKIFFLQKNRLLPERVARPVPEVQVTVFVHHEDITWWKKRSQNMWNLISESQKGVQEGKYPKERPYPLCWRHREQSFCCWRPSLSNHRTWDKKSNKLWGKKGAEFVQKNVLHVNAGRFYPPHQFTGLPGLTPDRHTLAVPERFSRLPVHSYQHHRVDKGQNSW